MYFLHLYLFFTAESDCNTLFFSIMKSFYATAITFLLLCAGIPATGQGIHSSAADPSPLITNAATRSDIQSAPLFKDISSSSPAERWAIAVKSISSRKHYTQDIEEIKEAKNKKKVRSMQNSEESPKSVTTSTPKLGVNFEANWMLLGTPADNTLAVSNGGYVVTANNDGIEYYNESGTFLNSVFWYDFFNDPNLTASIYDPKVIYDSGADRFILIVLHGSTASTSKVIVCFSKSNNPMNGWWSYQLTGNPLNNNCWFDYPNLGITNNEIFVTGNLFSSSSNTFNQAVVFQIQKNPGYTGSTINWQYWKNLDNTTINAFALVPASNGLQGNVGPDMYLVSTRSGGSDKMKLWHITNEMDNSPQMTYNLISTASYSPSGDAFQYGTNDRLDNGDCRIQNAFYTDGIIHFVFHTDIGEGWNGIRYNRLTVSNLNILSSSYGLQGSYDYSYPAVAPFTTSASDKSVMIAFQRSSSTSYPETRVVNCDNNFEWSSSTLVKAGETYVDVLTSTDERWGDYTGISRKHNSQTPSVWLAGSYGANVVSEATYNTWKTWVSEVHGTPATAIDETRVQSKPLVYPNPAYDLINIQFTTEQKEATSIEIIDLQGKRVKLLYQDTPKPGENNLRFNKGVLPAGTYFVIIKTASKVLKNEKLVILN